MYFDFHFKHLVYADAEPNDGHKFIANLEKTGKHISVVTQNIDELHQKAGSTEVYELHGTVFDNYCLTCGQHYPLNELMFDSAGIPRCPKDNGIVRPNIVMYEEQLDEKTIAGAISVISQAELLIVLGTSLLVYPAASFVQYFSGKQLVVINRTPLQLSNKQNILVFEDSIDNVFGQLTVENS